MHLLVLNDTEVTFQVLDDFRDENDQTQPRYLQCVRWEGQVFLALQVQIREEVSKIARHDFSAKFVPHRAKVTGRRAFPATSSKETGE